MTSVGGDMVIYKYHYSTINWASLGREVEQFERTVKTRRLVNRIWNETSEHLRRLGKHLRRRSLLSALYTFLNFRTLTSNRERIIERIVYFTILFSFYNIKDQIKTSKSRKILQNYLILVEIEQNLEKQTAICQTRTLSDRIWYWK